MPRAVSDPTESKRFDLVTCSEGFVELRKLSYGESLHRRELAMKATMAARSNDISLDVKHRDLQIFDFQKSIVNHNLEDVDGRSLDFRNLHDINKLNTDIALEIEMLIHKLNGRDQEMTDDMGKLNLPSGTGSMEER